MRSAHAKRTPLQSRTPLATLALVVLAGSSWLLAQEASEAGKNRVMVRAPGASTRMHLPDLFPDSMNLGVVARKVSDALNRANYADQGWYVVRPSWSENADSQSTPVVVGFAVVTKLEQIAANGAGKSPNDLATPDVSHTGSFLDAVKLVLEGAPKGRYRIILLWVSNDTVSQAKNTPPADKWQDYLREGTKGPWLSVLDTIPLNYGGGGGCYAFVYEYERSAVTGETQFVSSSSLSAEQHLKAAGIWDALVQEDKKK